MTIGKPINISVMTKRQRHSFRSKIARTANGCWPWQGLIHRRYGRFGIGSRSAGTYRIWQAHRLAWQLSHPRQVLGPGDCVLHKCDNPPCCRVAHLWVGTQAENLLDMARKGRCNPPRGDRHGTQTHPEKVPRGETHGMAKLTEADVRAIRSSNEIQRTLAARLGVTKATISIIRNYLTWKHVS